MKISQIQKLTGIWEQGANIRVHEMLANSRKSRTFHAREHFMFHSMWG